MAINQPTNQGLTQSALFRQQWDLSGTIGSSNVPMDLVETKVAAYGQLATCHFITSLTQLTEPGPNTVSIEDLTNPPTGATLATIKASFNGQTVFGGNYLHGAFSIDSDEAQLWARDFAGVLFDTRKSLSSLAGGYTNLTVDQFVTNIATQYGFTPRVGTTEGAGTKVGTIATANNGMSVMNTFPRPIWDFLVFLARMVGANLYVTSDKILVFEDAGANTIYRNYVWGGTPNDYFVTKSVNGNPIANLSFLHQPARNNNFSVVIISHHSKSSQISAQSVFVAGEKFTINKTINKGAGIYKGSDGLHLTNVSSSKGLGIPIYQYQIPELTQDQCAQRAMAIATDIASRLVVATLVVDGDASVKPLDQINLIAGSASADPSIYGFANRQYYVTSVTHSDAIVKGDSIGTEGFKTTIKALTIPPPSANLSGADIGALTGGF